MDWSVNDPLVGRVLDGRYVVRARIAAGGMATVYRALDTRLDREVAVKVMLPSLAADEVFVDRFIREAKAAARLSHPNVVGVFDQGRDGDEVFLAMEYVEGRTLRELLRDLGALTPREAFGVLEPVLAALAAAHHAGFVHRDVKPENVLISDDGGVKVADFGLARATASAASAATGKVLVGTVAYLAPEQVERGEASPRSDVYAAGVVLYETLTGRQPHAGATAVEVIYKHVHTDVPAPSLVVPGLSPALDTLVRAATVRDPAARPADAAEFLELARETRYALSAAELDHRTPAAGGPPGRHAQQQPPQPPHPPSVPAAMPPPVPPAPAAPPADDLLTMTREVELPPELRLLGLPSESARDDDGAYGYDDRPSRAELRRSGGGRRRPSRGQVAFLVVLLLALGIGVGAWWYGSGRYDHVPAVIALNRADAQKRIESAGLKVRFAEDFSETVPADAVISTSPGAGGRLLDGGTVTVHVSRGPERYAVPNLAGQPLQAAQAALTAAHLAPGQVNQTYSPQPVDTVVSTTPAAGTMLPPDGAVQLTVSKGPAPVPAPSVVGMTPDQAAQVLQQSSGQFVLNLSPTQVSDPTIPAGSIVSQTPAAGTPAPVGSQITVTVSSGPTMVAVPDLSGQNADQATATLQAAGLQAQIIGLPIGPRNVVRQSPDPGTMVPQGSTVTVWVM